MENIGLEDERREFKKSTAELKEGLIALTAMLNRNGQGVVYFGVRDNGDIIGQIVDNTTLDEVNQAIKTRIDPSVYVRTESMKLSDGTEYIVVAASGTLRPYAYEGVVYMRTGTEDRKVSMIELRRMFTSSCDNLVHTTSNNQHLTFMELATVLKNNGCSTSCMSANYRNLDLYNGDQEFNIQAQLLSDQNPVVLTVTVFRGRGATFISQQKTFSGHFILKEMEEVMRYVSALNDKFTYVDGSKYEERSLFDETVFREAWVNACVHNNWAGVQCPAVNVFDDRMEVISYGNRPYWLSEESFYSGCSMPVNESLMRIFIDTGLSEGSGRGIPAIIEACGRDSIVCSSSGVVVTIPFCRERMVVGFREGTITLSEKEKRILGALALHPGKTLDDIAEITGASRSYVGRTVVKLQGAGIVVREGSRKNGLWKVHQFDAEEEG